MMKICLRVRTTILIERNVLINHHRDTCCINTMGQTLVVMRTLAFPELKSTITLALSWPACAPWSVATLCLSATIRLWILDAVLCFYQEELAPSLTASSNPYWVAYLDECDRRPNCRNMIELDQYPIFVLLIITVHNIELLDSVDTESFVFLGMPLERVDVSLDTVEMWG